jgi:hypothetical protein
MTTRKGFADVRRESQDSTERHVFDEAKYVDGAGMFVSVEGNGTVDEDVPVLRPGGNWVHLRAKTDSDVYLISGGDDTIQKYAIVDIPRDKQRKTREGTSGIQHPENPIIAVEISDKGVRVTGENFAVGKDGVLEVRDGAVYVRGDLHVSGAIRPASSAAPNIPAFDADPVS